MKKRILKFLDWLEILLYRTGVVTRFEGIAISDLRNQSTHFRDTILAALQLIKATDLRRFSRVQRHLDWIVNCTLSHPGAEYHHRLHACEIDFEEPTSQTESDFSIGWYAKVIVHEATHGAISSRQISYVGELRSRIERLCVEEEHRFLNRLSSSNPQLAADLYEPFDSSDWNQSWAETPSEEMKALFRRLLSR